MIDRWFKNDLQNIYEQHTIAVVIDETGEAEFLLKTVEGEGTVYRANSELEELHVKYLIEKVQPSDERFLIYTNTKKDELKFIREYCETCGCLEIFHLQNYIKGKVHQTLNLNINLPKEDLIAAAKVSVGKDRNYWLDISHKGATEIFDLKKELLPFLHDPEAYAIEKYDAQLRETFYRKVNDLLGQEYLNKPATTLAGEVVKAMLDGLAAGCCNKTLESVYENWLDSNHYRVSFSKYLGSYALDSDLDIWNTSIDHPFRQVDERWFAEVGKNLSAKDYITNILSKLHQRDQSRQAQALGILFWNDVIALLEFDPADINYLSTFSECVEFYKNHFYKLDTAVRHLYTEFLNKKELLEPLQELYKEHVSVFLDQWFKHWNDYQEQQTGLLQRIINEAGDLKTAIVVGDGVAYEMAELVATKVKGSAVLKKDSIIADIPSETENNMSRIYMDNGVTEAVHRNREKYLVSQNPDVTIEFVHLDEVNEETRSSQILICTYKDIDDMGEKLQQKALKYFAETIDIFAEKISLLLDNGYSKVFLISDHGFVLTGLLSEADKISTPFTETSKKAERYIELKEEHPDGYNYVVEENEGKYFCFAKSINPFKSTGTYGYAHGGASPQELITPYFCWERSTTYMATLPVAIENKEELEDVTGELFSLKIQAGEGAGDLFSMERRVIMVFFAKKTLVNKSDVITIKPEEKIAKDYTFDGNQHLEVQLLDADTKQQLDKATIKQNTARDLGGLL